MISNAELVLLDMLRKQLLGRALPSNLEGRAGREIENLLIEIGIPVDKYGIIDIRQLLLEVKSRRKGSTSAQTIGSMLIDDIKATANWKDTPLYTKMCKQLRFTTAGTDIDEKANVIVNIDIVDFDQSQIQELVEAAYTHSRDQLIAQGLIDCCKYKGFIAYFERVEDTNSYQFRLSESNMEKAIGMAKSTFQQIFEYGV